MCNDDYDENGEDKDESGDDKKDEEYDDKDGGDDKDSGAKYVKFSDLMAVVYPSYTWSKIDVTTSDGYIIAMYHIYNETARTANSPNKGPVMWMHGAGGNPTEFLAGAGASN